MNDFLKKLPVVQMLTYGALGLFIVQFIATVIGNVTLLWNANYEHQTVKLIVSFMFMLISQLVRIVWEPLILLGLAKIIEKIEAQND